MVLAVRKTRLCGAGQRMFSGSPVEFQLRCACSVLRLPFDVAADKKRTSDRPRNHELLLPLYYTRTHTARARAQPTELSPRRA